MTILFVILIIIAAVVLGFFVLVQNPKGGGLAGSFSGISDQLMGVKQTNDVLEKGTWIFAAVIGLLCILSVFFISGNSTADSGLDLDKATSAPVPSSPQQNVPPAVTLPGAAAPAAGDTAK